jgi:protein gp37
MRLAGSRLRWHPSRRGLTKDSKAGPVWTGEVQFNSQWLDQPFEWRKPRMIFVAAHGDLFHHGVSDAVLDAIFDVMEKASHHTYQVLTTRAARMRAYVNRRYGTRFRSSPAHIWFGVSCEDQPRADDRIAELMGTNAAVRFLSLEPLLGPIEFNLPLVTLGLPMSQGARLHWVIVGGESGAGARPMRIEWVRSLRDQCQVVGIAFFLKQWGGRTSKAGGRELDGVEHNAMPEVAA